MDEIRIFQGGISVDDRGEVLFVNDFNFEGVKRFYVVSNHQRGFIRAWHAHRREGKYVTVITGAALVGAVKIDNWDNPARDVEVQRLVVSAKTPKVIYIPPGYANGFMSLTSDLKIVFFSTASLEESQGDDIRYEARYWDIWNTIER